LGGNPASLAFVKRFQITAGYLAWFQQTSVMNALISVQVPKMFSLGVLVQSFSSAPFDNFDSEGSVLKDLTAGDLVMGLTLARTFGWFSAGVSAKALSTRLAELPSVPGFAADLGCQARFTVPVISGPRCLENLVLGLAVGNLGPGQTFVSSSSRLPMKFQGGVEWKMVRSREVGLRVITEAAYGTLESFRTSLSCETELFSLVKIRIGYKLFNKGFGNLAIGAGIAKTMTPSRFAVDYALVPSLEFGFAHAIGLSIQF
jgi:hypothetical protein